MSPKNYYPPIKLKDAEGHEFEFSSELITKGGPPFKLVVWISRDGQPYAKREFAQLPMQGQVQNFAEGFVEKPAFRKRFLLPEISAG